MIRECLIKDIKIEGLDDVTTDDIALVAWEDFKDGKFVGVRVERLMHICSVES